MKVGDLVTILPRGEAGIVLETDIDPNQENVCLILHPDGETAWQYKYDLEVVQCS